MSVLVIAAHPDDETLGVGGTIARLSAEGVPVHVHVLADGVTGRHQRPGYETGRDCVKAATKQLGATCSFGGFGQDGQLLVELRQREIVRAIDEVLENTKPSRVFTHHPGDIHADHRAVSAATAYATKSFSHTQIMEVLHYEVLSSTEQAGSTSPFIPTVHYDITDFLAAKQRALAEYPTEIHPFPHPRSAEGVLALARYRGLQCGRDAAESFTATRIVR